MKSPANSGCVAPGWAATAARAVCKINEQALINKPEAGGNPHLKPGEAARAIGDGSAHSALPLEGAGWEGCSALSLHTKCS